MTDKTDALQGLASDMRNTAKGWVGDASIQWVRDCVFSWAKRASALAEQPAGGAVACPTCKAPCKRTEWELDSGEFGYNYEYTRPSAAAAVPRFDFDRARTLIGYVMDYCNATTLKALSSDACVALRDLNAMLAAAPAAPTATASVLEGRAPDIAAAEAMGAHGAPSTEGERLAFEAWMRGHCWALCATWSGTEYRSDAEQDGSFSPYAARTRMLWAAWRDRAALVSEQASAPKGAVVDEATQKVIDNAHENYLRGNIDATTRDYLIEKAKSAALATPRAEQGGQEVGS